MVCYIEIGHSLAFGFYKYQIVMLIMSALQTVVGPQNVHFLCLRMRRNNEVCFNGRGDGFSFAAVHLGKGGI